MVLSIQDSLEITQKNFDVDDLLSSEPYRSQIETFFQGKGSKKLLFYYQPNEDNILGEQIMNEQNFFLTSGDQEELKSKAIYFLRTSPDDRPPRLDDLENDIMFGEISPNLLEQVSLTMSDVFQPIIDKISGKDWGDCDPEQRKEFNHSTQCLVKDLEQGISSLSKNIEKCKIDQIKVNRFKSELELNIYYEDLFSSWIQDFREILSNGQKEDHYKKNQANDVGPKSELKKWKKIFQEITLLIELTRTSDFKSVKNSLLQMGNKGDDKRTLLLDDYKELENTVTERINEAKDNVKYLTTLDKFIEPLYSGSIESIIETLPALMNAIKMIHTIARYYNTSNKMTNLFVKITRQMIENCQNRILNQESHEQLWNKDPSKLIKVFNSCVNLSQKYKYFFKKTKQKASELPKSRHWDFDEAVIFGKFNLFVKRVKKLIELFSTIQQFDSLRNHSNLEGMIELTNDFHKILENFKKKNHNLLDYENIKLEKDYVELMQKIQKLDSNLQEFIDQNFYKLKNISYSLKLLKKFEKILKRDSIRNRLTNKYELILQNYGQEIDTIQKLFDEHKMNPPVPRNIPGDAGRIIWVRHLFKKLYGPIEEFPPNLINSKEMKKYIDKYNLIGQNLIIYELYFTQSWCNDIDRAKACLQTTLLIMKNQNGQKILKVNFQSDIKKLLREAKALEREGVSGIPESAKIILLQEDKFKNYYFQLEFIRSEYERILGNIKPIMKNLLIPHIEDMDLKLRPGMVTLTWTSMNIDGFIQNVRGGLGMLEQLVVSLNDIIENRIENNLKMIGQVVLVKLPQNSEPLSLEEFVQTQQTHIKEKAELLISKNTEIERSVDDLIHGVLKYQVDPHIEAVDARVVKLVKQYYFWYFYQALLNATQNSLNQMKDRICGKKTSSSQIQRPFFEVSVTFEDGEVKLVPNLQDIQKAINRAATAVLSCSKQMLGWDQVVGEGSESKDKESYYKIIAQDKEIVKVILLLTGSIQGTKNKINEYLQSFGKYDWLWTQNIQEEIKAFQSKEPDLNQYEEKLKKFSKLENEIDRVDRQKEIGAMALKTDKLVSGLKARCQEWKNNFAFELHEKAKGQLNTLTENIKNLQLWLHKEVKDIDSLGLVMNTLEQIRKEQSEIDLKFAPVLEMYALLDFHLPGGITDKEEVDNRSLLKKKWDTLIEFADEKQIELQSTQGDNLQKLKENIRQLVDDVKILRQQFEDEGPMVQGITPKEASDRLKRFENEYELKKAFYDINKRGEDLFGLRNQQYPALEKTHDQIQNLNKLYALYNQVNETTSIWEEEAWSELKVNQIKDWEEQILKYSELCSKLPKSLREWQAYKDLREKIENYKNIFPLIKELKDPMIKNRHWERIIELSGKRLNYAQPDNFYFKELVEVNLMENYEDIEDVIDSAKKQHKIENTKNEIKFEWNKLEFVFKTWGKKREVPILSGLCVEEIQERLEEDISTLSGLGAMRHIGPFKEEVQQLQETLIDIQTNLNLWVKVQILWTSLESVFTEGDISMILTTESKKFSKIDKAWVKTIMEKATEQKLVKLCCQNEIIKSILPNIQEELEACQKQLEKYLEMKRKSFSRFYFVSDSILLQFLSKGSDPESIQDEFDKLFDSIQGVEFESVDKKSAIKQIISIKSIIKEQTEVVKLTVPVVCKDYIEKWLINLEKMMQISVNGIIKEAYFEITSSSLKDGSLNLRDFIDKYQAQVVLLGLQMKWTKLVSEALEKRGQERNKAVNDAKSEINDIMELLTDFCREDLGSKMNEKKIQTLVTIMVYLKKVTKQWRFREVTDFEWLKFTRFYWDMDANNSKISITDWEIQYKNEYLGVKERLCITPLTDRCYISLAQAMSMHYGGAPAGPAGTGKTETVKDLGRTLGIYVIVTNCSKEHRYTDMAKIFKGLSQSGLWGCFDEFNRIELEVLSVVAMQIESITAAKKAGLSEFMFPDEVKKISLQKSCGYFITMNPGYAGRQELPENLKVLFRGVTMMVPDREIIIRVKLASYGYKEYEILAKKFKILYQLCEEQLSKQKHYDFGLRNILSVLRTAGDKLQKEQGEADEKMLMMITLRDMNHSKLVTEDVSLFNALMRDIFPSQTEVKKKKGKGKKKEKRRTIRDTIVEKIEEFSLEVYDPFVLKVVQLYETSLVRHGFMLVGGTCSGKTTITNILVDSMASENPTQKYSIIRLNPKAFTSQQMYGVMNFAGEWTEGIFSKIWQNANMKKPNKAITWIVCDGPVDSIWIENLNTVLDDNKMLTLANGERTAMLDTVKMVFEVQDLRNASLATVSRCGQIYISEDYLGHITIIKGWIKERTKREHLASTTIQIKHPMERYLHTDDAKLLQEILLRYFEKLKILEAFDKINLKNRIMDMNYSLVIIQTLKILDGLIYRAVQAKTMLQEQDYEKLVVFCLLWGIAGMYEFKERMDFVELLRTFKEHPVPLPKLSSNDTPFDFHINFQHSGISWKQIKPEKWKPPKELYYSRLLLPTIDSMRSEILLNCLMNTKNAVLFMGGSGTAKTSSILMYCSKFDSSKKLFHRINFSSATLPHHFQVSIESVCDVKIRKGYGPADGKKMTVFIDDISMPAKNEWGDQITLEIVRELVEDSGFYFLDKNERGNFRYIENLSFIAAMNHPGGGRNDIPNRLKHHFVIINTIIPQRLELLFDPILHHVFKKSFFDDKVNKIVSTLCGATLRFWNNIKNQLLPTPSKFHYLFNLRDLSRVFKGICTVHPDTINQSSVVGTSKLSSPLFLIMLWRNECQRVFIDKLVNKTDINKALLLLKDSAIESFPDYEESFEKLFETDYFFCDFTNQPIFDEDDEEEGGGEEGVDPDEYVKRYEISDDLEKLRAKSYQLLKWYNKQNPSNKMDLVLFDDALHHLLRISRIIQMPRSSALLVGVGGSGKQSLSRFAAHIGGHQTFKIQLTKTYNENNLKEDIKFLFDIAGHKGKPITFILSDAEVKNEGFLEYINMILSTGEIPGLIPKDEKEVWLGDVRTHYVKKYKGQKEPSAIMIYEYFLNRLRDNLHIVLCFSPVGTKFRDRARKFPALFNECCIDWFLEWPQSALSTVAEEFMSQIEVEAKPEVRKQLPLWMAKTHQLINGTCEDYYNQMRRAVFVTPKSYLTFIRSYQKLYQNKHHDLSEAESNYKLGLKVIAETKEEIEIMEVKLKKDQEVVQKKKEEVEKIISKLNVQRSKAQTKGDQVKTDKAKIQKEKQKIEADKEVCEKELALSLPDLIKAQKSASQITQKEIGDLKPILQQKAHIVMKYIVDAIQIVLYQRVRNDIVMLEKPLFASKKQDEKSKIDFFEDSWDIFGKQAFFQNNLVEKLQMMAKTENENLINGEILELLEPYTRNSQTWLSKEYAMNAFNKMGLIHEWMTQIEKFSVQTKNIKPKRLALKKAENKLKEASTKLQKTEKQLAIIEANCLELDQVYKVNNDEKIKLEEAARLKKKKIDQANRLINSLADERERWNIGATELSDFKRRLIGNVGLATAFISYCGPFNAKFRDMIAQETLLKELLEMNIPHTQTIYKDLTSFLVDEATIGQWNLEGLPKDVLSIQNGIMVENSDRFPLLIDPQNQGSYWIKNKYNDINPETGLGRIFLVNINEEKKFRDGLTRSIENGEVMILEGIEQEVDPILDPVLEKQIIKKNRKLKLMLGGSLIDYHKDFKLFLTCKLSNPRFSPELSAKTTIIDFTVTQEGLEQQLLSVVLSKKQRVLEESLQNLLKQVTMNKKELQKLDKILLRELTQSDQNLLDDDNEVIEILNNTKTQAKEMKVKLQDAEIKTKEINEKRLTFKPVAVRGSVLYFSIIEISQVNWMYNSSLNQFLQLYHHSIDTAPEATMPAKGVENITRELTYNVYRYVNRGLFKKDKQTYLLMVCFKILITDQKLSNSDVSMFLKAGSVVDKANMRAKPQADWLKEKQWKNIIALSNHRFKNDGVPFFQSLPDSIENGNGLEKWRKWAYENTDPENFPVPDFEDRIKNENEIGPFLKFCLIRCIREDRTVTACNQFITSVLGEDKYIEPVNDSLPNILKSSSSRVPILFLLSAGADPTSSIDEQARSKKKIINKVSLGEGQEPKALSLLNDAIEKGDWVLLQNCHLGLDFMSQLDTLLIQEEWIGKAHPEFRIWMSCEPREGFPLGLLQKAVKVTNEPPKGMKAGLHRTFSSLVNSEFIERIDHPNWRILVYATSFLHSVVQERRKFGPLGWCIPYEFNFSDLEASLAFIEKYLNQLQLLTGISNPTINFPISYPVLIYMICEIQYGGKITDNLDRELFSAYGEKYYRETLLQPECQLVKLNNQVQYIVPKGIEHKQYMDYILTLPAEDNPEIFGLNPNADMMFRLKETNQILNTIMNTRPKEGSGQKGKTREEIIQEKSRDFLAQVIFEYPEQEIRELIKKLPGPKLLDQRGLKVPLNIFLYQEIQRMNNILSIVKQTFSNIIEAVEGTIIMTPDIVNAIDSIYDGKVPRYWVYDTGDSEISWIKPNFASWFESLMERNSQLSSWLKNGRPRTFNLGLFFNPQGFLTAMKQEVVRSQKNAKQTSKNVQWSMDNVEYSTNVLSDKQQRDFENGKDIYQEGVYITGLFLEGCKWSKEGLQDLTEKVLTYPLNILHVTAVATNSRRGIDQEKRDSAYDCPVYKYPQRNDFYLIFRVFLPYSGMSNDKNKWKLRGVALLCSTE